MSIKYSIPAEKREALAALSKEVYGASSKYLKLMDKGRLESETYEVTELVPRADDSGESDERKVRVPVKYQGAEKSQVLSRRKLTLEEVEKEMNEIKAFVDGIKAAQKARQEEARKAKELAELEQNVAKTLSGSVL